MNSSIEIASLSRLIETGVIKLAARSEPYVRRWETARWIEPTGRKGEWRIRDGMKFALEQRLCDIAPTWEEDLMLLRSNGMEPYDPCSIEVIPALKKSPSANGLINRRNWNAACGLSPKHRAKLSAKATLTKDWILRFRPSNGLIGTFAGNNIHFAELAEMLTECTMPQRLWLQLEGFSGVSPQLVITCENLGAYIDLHLPGAALAIYAPGADIEPAAGLVKQFPDANWIHFGDIDPEGLQIAESLAAIIGRPMSFFVPSFASEYLPGSPVETPWGIIPNQQLFHELCRTRKRIFQEVFMLDPRLSVEIAENYLFVA